MRKHLVEHMAARAAQVEEAADEQLEADRRRLIFRVHAEPARTAEHYANALGMTVERVVTILEAMVAEGGMNSGTPEEAG